MINVQGTQQHDKFFRAAMGYQSVALEFFQCLLPSAVARQMNLDSLKLEPKNYISDDLQECFSDVVYSCKLPSYSTDIFLLIEHQSSPDRMIAFRVLNYLTSLLSSYEKQHSKRLLPAVKTIVVYHGGRCCNTDSLDLQECFYDPLAIMSNLQYKMTDLVDVNTLSDQELYGWPWFGPVALALKYSRSKELLRHVERIFSMLGQLVGNHGARRFRRLVLEYLFQVGNIDDVEEFVCTVKQRVPERVGRTVMTLAEYFEQQGREEGRLEGHQEGKLEGWQEGKLEGRQEGKLEGRQEVVLSMLNEGADLAFVAKVSGLSRTELTRLKQLTTDNIASS